MTPDEVRALGFEEYLALGSYKTQYLKDQERQLKKRKR